MNGPQSAMLSVYDGQRCLGRILQRGKRGYEAFDADDNSLGIFSTTNEAANAITRAAEGGAA
jgi:hypothetical protein